MNLEDRLRKAFPHTLTRDELMIAMTAVMFAREESAKIADRYAQYVSAKEAVHVAEQIAIAIRKQGQL